MEIRSKAPYDVWVPGVGEFKLNQTKEVSDAVAKDLLKTRLFEKVKAKRRESSE